MDDRRLFSCRIWCSFSSSSISTSCISAPTPSSLLIASPSFSIRAPKTRNSAAAAKCVNRSGISVGTAWPRTAERTVITKRAEKAALKTRRRSCFIAMRAAIKKVLSPISEKRIMVRERRKEWRGWIIPSFPSSSMLANFDGSLVVEGLFMSRWFLSAEPGIGWGRLFVLSGRSLGFCIIN